MPNGQRAGESAERVLLKDAEHKPQATVRMETALRIRRRDASALLAAVLKGEYAEECYARCIPTW